MNLKKLDTIKTPESWKKELLNQEINMSSEENNGKFIKIRKMNSKETVKNTLHNEPSNSFNEPSNSFGNGCGLRNRNNCWSKHI